MTQRTRLVRIPDGVIACGIVVCAIMMFASVSAFAQQPDDSRQSPIATTSSGAADTIRQQMNTAIPPDPGFGSIQVLAREMEDSVVLRWAPTTPHAWRVGNRVGYLIERRTSSNGETVLLTPQPVVPWEVEPWGEWLQSDSSNAFIGIAVYALYADTTLMGLADSLGQDTLSTNAERNANLYGYALFAADNDAGIATALGLRFVDRRVKRGEQYTYTIRLARPQTYRIDPGSVTVSAGKSAPTGLPPKNLVGTGMDGKIQLQWQPPSTGIRYSAYNVFRSESRGRTYTRLNATPIAILVPNQGDVPARGVFTDTTIVNYRTYRYQIKGIDAFGESGAAAEVEAFGRDLTPPPQPVVNNAEQIASTKLRMRWDMVDVPGDLAGFNVLRSASADSNYKKLNTRLLSPRMREYIDEKANDREPYYIISAVDTAGNAALSFPLYGMLIDTIAPAVPVGLRGTIDTTGHVRLRWNRNRESNIIGYRVLRANAPDHEFTQLTGSVCRDTFYVDSIDVSSLTRSVYYRIAAVNARFGHSQMSPILTLRRQQKNMPTAPVFTDVVSNDESIELKWAVNSEDKLRAIVLFRRSMLPDRASPHGTVTWDTLASLRGSARSFIDRRVEQKMTYEYQLAVVDSTDDQFVYAELPVQGRSFDTGVRPAVRKVTAALAKESNAIRLDWTYQTRENDRTYFVIYRSVDGGEFISLKSVPGTLRTFADRALIGDGTYRYRIQVATSGGAESPLSEPVSVLVASKKK
ncbi:MAG TPA: hypothetical protein VK470_19675 [Bacteroidota bacterium]|nr:hypothetical protein [Bacteroidota bacterium]